MSLENVVFALIAAGTVGAVVTAAVTLLTTRHKPKVDSAQVVITGQGGFIDDLQARLKEAEARADRERARADTADEMLRQERMRHDTKERAWQAAHDDQQRQIGAMGAQIDALAGHVLVLEVGVEEQTIPPIPGHPLLVRHLLRRARDENSPVIYADTGTPGVDVNPPIPDPPDDGQPKDLTHPQE